MQEWLVIYLAGGIAAVILGLLKTAGFYAYNWFSKSNVVAKNLRKIDPSEESISEKVSDWAFVLLLSFLLSWIAVASALLWEIPVAALRVLRELFTATPEAVKVLRFPLRTNPYMSSEAVFAHVTGLNQLVGANAPTAVNLIEAVDNIRRKVPSFQADVALDQLAALKVVDESVLSAAKRKLEDPLYVTFFRGLKHGSKEQDEKEYWVYNDERNDLRERFDPKGKWNEGTILPREYESEMLQLQWQHRGMLWRRNDWSVEDFREAFCFVERSMRSLNGA